MKKNVRYLAVALAVSVISVNAFGSGIPSYANGIGQQGSLKAQGGYEGLPGNNGHIQDEASLPGSAGFSQGTGLSPAGSNGEAQGSGSLTGSDGGTLVAGGSLTGSGGEAPGSGSPAGSDVGSQENGGSLTGSDIGTQGNGGSPAGSNGEALGSPAESDGEAPGSGSPAGSDVGSQENGGSPAGSDVGSQENGGSPVGSNGEAPGSGSPAGSDVGSQENDGISQANEEDAGEGTESGGQAEALEKAFAEMVGGYDLYAMLANGQEFPVRRMPEESSEALHTLPSGYQVKLAGVVVTQDMVWFQVEYGYQDVSYRGYIQEDYIVTQDTRLQEWKDLRQGTYGVRNSARGAAGNTDLSAFPKSYQSYIKKLVAAHPNWTFVPMNTGLDWSEVVENEAKPKVNLVDNSDPNTFDTWKSTDADSYDISTGKWIVKEGSTWVQASRSILKYYLDPRNFLNEDSVFQFEQLTYNGSYHTEAGVEKVLSGTFMSGKKLEDGSGGGITYAQAFMKIGQELKVSPFFLASRVRQEQGVSGNSSLISGTYPGYKGYYNYFNRQATGVGEAVIINGLKEAKSKGWNTRYKALKGGAESVSADYITKGQDTFYLQKFDVDASYNGLYWHQYMQNLLAADSEGKSVRKSYTEMGTIDNSFVFKVPVYKNMPSAACGKPGGTLKKTTLSAAKSGDSAVKLTWKEIPGAIGYEVLRAEGDGKYSKVKNVNGLENTSYLDKNIVQGKVYSYKVRGFLRLYGGTMKSSSSAAKSVDFGVSKTSWRNLKLKDYTTAVLYWNEAPVTGYRIYRKVDDGEFTRIKTITDKAKISYKDTKVLPGHTYTYRIRCYNKVNGVNYYSSYTPTKAIQVKMPAASLDKAVVSGGSKVKLSWSRDAKAQGYQIYRATSANGKFTRVKSITDNAKLSWSDSKVSAGNKYYYKIRSFVKTSQGTKTSGFSKTLSVDTVLAKPALSSAKGVSKGIKLTWKKAKNAAGYKVYRSTSKNGAYKQVKRIASNAMVSATDKNASKGKTYYYKVKSFSLFGGKGKHSAYSNRLSAKC